jgi:hypothetical protein
MSLSRDSRNERKWKAWRRMQFAFKQRCERIDFEEDVLLPEINAMKANKEFAGIAPAALMEFEIVDETPNPIPNADGDSQPADPADGSD